jgi:transposase
MRYELTDHEGTTIKPILPNAPPEVDRYGRAGAREQIIKPSPGIFSRSRAAVSLSN